jgi:hypothetical protein
VAKEDSRRGDSAVHRRNSNDLQHQQLHIRQFLQDELRSANSRTIQELNAKLPSFGRSAVATASWIPVP